MYLLSNGRIQPNTLFHHRFRRFPLRKGRLRRRFEIFSGPIRLPMRVRTLDRCIPKFPRRLGLFMYLFGFFHPNCLQ